METVNKTPDRTPTINIGEPRLRHVLREERPPARVLVVDDDPDSLQLLKLHLEVAHYEVTLTQNSQEACMTDKSSEGEFAVPGTLCPHLICIGSREGAEGKVPATV